MSRVTVDEAPTMLIPKGTRIEIDTEGKLSITAPGNLVVQSSGKYGTLESLGGSIRIDRGAEVEAVAVRCAETCFVHGFLTAWKVSAKLLHLEDSARAHIVLQETKRLQAPINDGSGATNARKQVVADVGRLRRDGELKSYMDLFFLALIVLLCVANIMRQ